MNSILNVLDDWLEVWPIAIPLTVIFIYRPKEPQLKPLVIYIYIAFLLNLTANLMYVFNKSLPEHFNNNNLLYNLHAVVRIGFFSWYLFSVRWKNRMKLLTGILSTLLLIIIIYFWKFSDPLYFNSALHSLEGVLLISAGLIFFLSIINDDSERNWMNDSSFLICIGICLLEAITIFIYLFFYKLAMDPNDLSFGYVTMTIRKIAYLILCILISIAFLKSNKRDNNNKSYSPAL